MKKIKGKYLVAREGVQGLVGRILRRTFCWHRNHHILTHTNGNCGICGY